MALSQGSWSPTSGMRENWLVQVYETDESGFKAYSFFDQTVNSVAYSGIILNNPSIRENINIFESSSDISNVSIEIDNSASESEALLFGSNDYLNGDVKIYSNLASGTIANFNDIPQIYHGRLESIVHTESSVVLNIVARRAWDNISLPNGYTSNKTIVPLVYGDYSGNSGTDFTDNYTNSNYHPAPFDGSDLSNSELELKYFLRIDKALLLPPEIVSEVICLVNNSNSIPVFLYLECLIFIINCNLSEYKYIIILQT